MEPRVQSGQFESFESHDPEDAVEAMEPTEGPVAGAPLPSDVFLWACLGTMAVSLALQLSGNKKAKPVSNFIGQWSPTLLVLGLYKRIVKVAGHGRD